MDTFVKKIQKSKSTGKPLNFVISELQHNLTRSHKNTEFKYSNSIKKYIFTLLLAISANTFYENKISNVFIYTYLQLWHYLAQIFCLFVCLWAGIYPEDLLT